MGIRIRSSRGGSPSATVEDYLKAVYEVCQRSKAGMAQNGDLAAKLSLAPGTVTIMVQRLAKAGLLEYQPHRGCWLTSLGQDAARRVVDRHVTIEHFLMDVLGLDAEQVHDEAENLEHSASDRLISEMRRYLKRAA